MRCINNGMSLEAISAECRWNTYVDTLPNFQTWCHCPCKMETYDPNTLDKLVVDFFLGGEDEGKKDRGGLRGRGDIDDTEEE